MAAKRLNQEISTEDRPAVSAAGGKTIADGATVLQVLPALETGGVERGTVDVANAVAAAGGRSIVASAGGLMKHELSRSGAEHVTLPVDSKNPLVMRANVRRLVRLINSENVDVVHARSRAPAWSAIAAANKTGCRFVTTFHGAYGHGKVFKRRYNSVMTRGERVIAISEFVAGHMREVYDVPAGKIRVIHRGVDVARFDPAKVSQERIIALSERWRLPDGVPVVMLPGRLTRWKGQRVFIDAVKLLTDHDVRCLIVGSDQGRDAYRKELIKEIEGAGLGGKIHVIDHCDDMPAAYMLTDVVISASIEPEAFGRVVTEAQALGRPVIATDHGGARETIIDGRTGWLTPPGDAEALAATIARVLDQDPSARGNYAARAVAHIRDNFTKDAMCAKTIAVYDELLNGAPAG